MEQTANGIKFNSYLTGPDGAHYELFPEKHHTKRDLDTGRNYIWDNFDPVSVKIIRPSSQKSRRTI